MSFLCLLQFIYLQSFWGVDCFPFFATHRYDISHAEKVKQLLTQFLMTGWESILARSKKHIKANSVRCSRYNACSWLLLYIIIFACFMFGVWKSTG